MNFIVDESVDRQIAEALRQHGHSVTYIAEVGPSISDEAVFDIANKQHALLITADKDFGEMVFRDGRLISDGIVLIRLSGLSSETKSDLVVRTIKEHENELPCHFTVITPGKVRSHSKANRR